MSNENIRIGDRLVGLNEPPYLVAEIGINHNGDINIAKMLIDKAVEYGFDAVKFQKRTIEVVFTPEELQRPRESPFGLTNGDLKRGLEFGLQQYREIDDYCREKGIHWFCSPWDEQSVDFLEPLNPVCYKVASASLTDHELLRRIKATDRPIILSTGMSTLEQVDDAVDVLRDAELLLMHTTSTYPSSDDELNLAVIETLRKRYGLPVGYSGHEVGMMPSLMAIVGFQACVVERHITLDRAMWGSDQAASLEPRGMELLTKYTKQWWTVRGDNSKRLLDSEVPIQQKLRRVK
jgi:N-acetylneuraminate synthase